MENLEKYGFRKGFNFDNRFNLKTRIKEYEISTVDLGINHQFIEGLPPLYYETMIFLLDSDRKSIKGNPFSFYQERYTTEKEARAGHKKAVKYVKKEIGAKNDNRRRTFKKRI